VSHMGSAFFQYTEAFRGQVRKSILVNSSDDGPVVRLPAFIFTSESKFNSRIGIGTRVAVHCRRERDRD